MANDVTVKFGANSAEVQKAVTRISASVAKMKQSLGTGLSAVGVGLGLGAAISFLRGLASEMDNLDKRAKQLGVTGEELQRLEFVSRQNKADVDIVSQAMLQLDRILGDLDKNKNAATALERLNIEADKFRELGVSERLYRLADAFSEASDKGAAFASLYELMGRQGRELIPLLSAGGDALRDQAGSITPVSDEDLAKIADMNDKFDELSTTWRNRWVGGLVEVGEAFEKTKAGLGILARFMGGQLANPFGGEAAGLHALNIEVEKMEAAMNAEKGPIRAREEAAKATLETAAAALEVEESKARLSEKLAKMNQRALESELPIRERLSLLEDRKRDAAKIFDSAGDEEQRAAAEKAVLAAHSEGLKLEKDLAAEKAKAQQDQKRGLDDQQKAAADDLHKKSREEATELELVKTRQERMNDAPFSALRQIGGGYRRENLSPISPRAPGAELAMNKRIGEHTARTAESVAKVAQSSEYSPEAELKELVSVSRSSAGILGDMLEALEDGVITEASFK